MMNVGIIGAGRIGKVHGESIMRYVKNATVKAIADPFMNEQTEKSGLGLALKLIIVSLTSESKNNKTIRKPKRSGSLK